MSEPPVVILGAGPAGISSAWQLAEAGRHVVVLEKEGHVGGLGATRSLNGFRLDYGPHILCVRETEENAVLMRKLAPLLGPDPLVFERADRILLRGKYYTYPVKILELLAGVPVGLAARILIDYVRANAALRFFPPAKDRSFEEWGVKNLGRTLYELCFGVYSRRVWGLPTSQISSRQAQRVAKLNLTEIILRATGLKIDPVHFRTFMYPRGGMGVVYERMAEHVRARGGQVQLGCPVRRLIRRGSRIERVVYQTPEGQEASLACEGVVSTVPLPVIAEAFDEPLEASVRQQAAQLQYRSLQFCYVVVKRERVTNFHWCYLLDERYHCNRISEQKNVDAEMIPGNQTVLLFEMSCDKGDQVWNATDAELRRLVEADIREAKILQDLSAIAGFFTRRVEFAYPVYKLHFEDNLFPVLEVLHRFDNFLSVGRHGLFLNNSMDDNMMLGVKVKDFLQTRQTGTWDPGDWFAHMNAFMQLRFAGK